MTSAETFKQISEVLKVGVHRSPSVHSTTQTMASPEEDHGVHNLSPNTVSFLPASSTSSGNTGNASKSALMAKASTLDNFDINSTRENGEAEAKKQTTWIPEVKRVVQFRDLRNNERVVPIEEFIRNRPKRDGKKGNLAEGLFKEYSMVLRKILGPDLRLRDYRLEIQSLGLRDIFRKIGKPFKELDLDAPSIIIRYPFRCLFFLRRDLKELEATPVPLETKKETKHLLEFIRTESSLAEIVKEYEEMVVKRSKFREDRAWTLFPPQEFVYFKGPFGRNSRHIRDGCGVVEKVELLEEPNYGLRITLLVGHHDGWRFGLVRSSHILSPSAGDVQDINIENLPVIPMRFLSGEKQNEIKDRVLRRGKDYISYCKADFRMFEYQGPVAAGEEQTKKLLGNFENSSSDGISWSWEVSAEFHPCR